MKIQIQNIKRRIELPLLICCGLLAVFSGAFAQNWVPTTATTNYWSAIACSADGSKLVAVAGGCSHLMPPFRTEGIYVSTNSGSTWTKTIAPIGFWTGVASSADGKNLIAIGVVSEQGGQGCIYASTNAGANWRLSMNEGPFVWSCVASSADASIMYAKLAQTSYLNFSTNQGVTWPWVPALHFNLATVTSLAASADGTKLIAGGNQVYTSTDSGLTWVTNNLPTNNWTVASSADGTKLAAVDGNGGPAHIYTSADSGTTWVSNNVPLLSWQYIAMSADGTHLIAAAWVSSTTPVGPIYTSSDSGQTWTSNSVPNVIWQGVACSADGNEFIAVSAGNGLSSEGMGQIWISQAVPRPLLTLAPLSGSITLSWPISSTNFVLQQSADLMSWSSVTDAPTLNFTNLNYDLILPTSNSNDFYRLMTP